MCDLLKIHVNYIACVNDNGGTYSFMYFKEYVSNTGAV